MASGRAFVHNPMQYEPSVEHITTGGPDLQGADWHADRGRAVQYLRRLDTFFNLGGYADHVLTDGTLPEGATLCNVHNCDYFGFQEVFYWGLVLPVLWHRYWQTPKPHVPLRRDAINVAVHVRRGDAVATHYQYTPNRVYVLLLQVGAGGGWGWGGREAGVRRGARQDGEGAKVSVGATPGISHSHVDAVAPRTSILPLQVFSVAVCEDRAHV